MPRKVNLPHLRAEKITCSLHLRKQVLFMSFPLRFKMYPKVIGASLFSCSSLETTCDIPKYMQRANRFHGENQAGYLNQIETLTDTWNFIYSSTEEQGNRRKFISSLAKMWWKPLPILSKFSLNKKLSFFSFFSPLLH